LTAATSESGLGSARDSRAEKTKGRRRSGAHKGRGKNAGVEAKGRPGGPLAENWGLTSLFLAKFSELAKTSSKWLKIYVFFWFSIQQIFKF
jgi:hypothetical protein